MHVTLDMYLLMLRGVLDPWQVLEAAHGHVLEHCQRCGVEWEELQGRADLGTLRDVDPRSGAETPAPSSRIPVLPELPESDDEVSVADYPAWKALEHRMRAQLWDATRDLKRLLRRRPEERRNLIENALTRYRSRAFTECLLAESRRRVRSDPGEAADLLSLLPTVIHWVPGAGHPPWADALLARAEAQRANAERAAGDLAAAAHRFNALRVSLRRQPITDEAALAEIDSLEASLCVDQRRLREAELLARRAVTRARRAAAPVLRRRALIQVGTVQRMLGRPTAALAALEKAASELAPDDESYEYVCLLSSKILVLCDLERYDEADEVLAGAERLLRREPHSGAYLAGLRGRVSLGLERWREAAECFRTAEATLLELGRSYDAALTILYRAHAHLGAGDTNRLRELASGLVPMFQARGVERETLGLLRLLAEAVAKDRASISFVIELRRRLRSVQT